VRTYATQEQIDRWLEAVRLRDAGMKLREIAEHFGMKEPNACQLVTRGRKWLAVQALKRKPVRRKGAVKASASEPQRIGTRGRPSPTDGGER